jgi:GT2 family glycosyltransferase
MTKPKVFVIIPVHNRWKLTKKCLDSFLKQDYSNTEIVVIDDGSTDQTSKGLKKYLDISVLKGDGSMYWTGAMYAGVEYALKRGSPSDMILSMNNDCTVDKNYVGNLVKKKSQKTIVGSFVVDSTTNRKIETGVGIDWKKGTICSLRYKSNQKIDTLPGKGTLFPIEVFKDMGNYNKYLLPHYGSDYEMVCRAIRHGYKAIISYDAKVSNLSKETGIENYSSDKLSFQELIELAFSKRSKINIINQLVFMLLCCPIYLWPINIFRIILKSLYLLSLTYPLNIIRRTIYK